MSTPRQRLWDVKAAAAYLGICRMTLYRLCKGGKLRVIRLGRAVRFRPEDLESFVERRSSKVK